MKVSLARILSDIGLVLLIGSAFTYELIRAVFGNMPYIIIVVCGAICITVWAFLERTLSLSGLKKFLPWILIGIISIWRNAEIAHGVYDTELLFILYVYCACVLSAKKHWQSKASYIIEFFGGLHVFATIILFFNNGIYSYIMSLWGYAPSGTDYGAAGYRAGLTTHYSQNATYIVLVLLIVGSRLVCKKKQERSKIELAWFLIIMIALLLTSKRGHLIFGVAALVIVYYILNSAKRDSKLFKLIAGGLGLSIVVVILFQIMPTTFNVLLGRFVNSGYDDVTSGRLPMWALAISLFSKNPILGIGWFGYKYQYTTHLWDGYNLKNALLNTHNVYLQILCETGIVGMGVFVLGVVNHLKYMMYLTRKLNGRGDLQDRSILAISLGMMIFFLMYSVTGCCLYDLTFYIFIICVAMGLALRSEES